MTNSVVEGLGSTLNGGRFDVEVVGPDYDDQWVSFLTGASVPKSAKDLWKLFKDAKQAAADANATVRSVAVHEAFQGWRVRVLPQLSRGVKGCRGWLCSHNWRSIHGALQ